MNPLLLEFPVEFETDRLLIRKPLPGDGAGVCHAINASISELKPWMPFAQKEQTVEECEVNIREAHVNFLNRTDLRLLVFKKDSGEFIASSGLHRINWEVPKFEIGYWIDTRHSGNGFMTEAAEGVSAFAFRELRARRVEIRVDFSNVKSRAVPERLGFTLEGILRNESITVEGKLSDTCV
ncbi:MAG TPA: GNAT family N-acetyltransferase, partial [Bacillus bacterium]|nr:GNAT family N-acetyltransferase [Bacillus sp. (in: firmicutes)]